MKLNKISFFEMLSIRCLSKNCWARLQLGPVVPVKLSHRHQIYVFSRQDSLKTIWRYRKYVLCPLGKTPREMPML